MAGPFQYQRLNSDIQEIRLVDFIPPDKNSRYISFTIRHVDLASSPAYHALSYRWGAPYSGLPPEWDNHSATHTIHLNGHEFQVHWNLEAALRSMSMNGAPTMWIDALCIDQSNILERNHQVQMMGNVYRNARTTLFWLGPGPDSFSGMVQAIQNCIKSRNKWSSRLWRGVPWQDLTVEEKTEYESHARDDFGRDTVFEEIDTLTRLLDCAWFRRAWVVQEAALSRDVFIFWGDDAGVTWGDLGATVDLLAQHKHQILTTMDLQFDHKRIINLLSRFLDSADHFRRIDGLRSMLQNGGQLNSLLIFFLLSNFMATDKRDHVYSGLGMLSDSTIIRVDYDLDVSEVLTKTTQVLMESNNDIHILRLCQGSRIPNLPSWSVDFTLNLIYPNLASSQIYAPSDRDYSAGGNTPAIFCFEDKTSILHGILISELFFVGSRKVQTSFWDKIWEEHSDRVTISGTAMTDFNQKQEELFIKSSRELQKAWLGEWFAHEGEMESTAHTFEKYPWTQEDIWSASLRTFHADSIRTFNNTTRMGKNFDWTQDGPNRISQDTLSVTLPDRVFAVTSPRQFCLVRNDAKIGDVVLIATGAETPYMLRPTSDGHYKFGSNCYVHGFMDGEALNQTTWSMDDRLMAEVEVKIV